MDDEPEAGHVNANENGNTAGDEDEAAVCDLHFIANCQSCSRWDENGAKEEDEDLGGTGWMSHKLTFAKDRLGKDLEWKRKNEEELVVIDPREREKELGVGKKARGDNIDQGRQRHRDRPSDRDRRR
jgi:peptidyl-prolyl cis-trans isomerase SDCCAG10